MEKDFKLMVAPLQGLTVAEWRRVYFDMFGNSQGLVEYFTPFIRVEKGVVRARDLRDFTSDLNKGMMLTPQIIFKDAEEWRLLVDTLAEAGAERVDMNMGCPFPPQVKKGRGAGMLSIPDRVAEIADEMAHYPEIQFSVKMRLGVNDPTEALALAYIINSMPLRHVTIHPRTAKQQYKGNLLLSEMKEFSSMLKHPIVFNGEIANPSDIDALTSDYDGVMVGRGLLARPSLFAEYHSGRELPIKQREEAFLNLINNTSSLLEDRLCGAAQLRDKMKPYWEYAPASLDKKIVKIGKKKGVIGSI
ncbi:MAG: tRNA-dihydrouridine synthase family protein [Muribaculaceae bacterium]|nr:tRNA-dihydrouridine synthase family protein [Muribaculaceae bacterium]